MWPVAFAAIAALEIGGGVQVENQTRCVDSVRLTGHLEQVLAAQAPTGAEGAKVLVVASETTEELTAIELKVTDPHGQVMLERKYHLNAPDCRNVEDLLGLVLERFLAELPHEAWSPRKTLEVGFRTAVHSEWAPLGGDLDLGFTLDIAGQTHALGTGILVRASAPHELATGNFQETSLLGGAGWRYGGSSWRNRLELRGGALLVSGYGFAAPESTWLPWLEVAESIEYLFNSMMLGAELALSPFRHEAVTRNGTSQGLSILRFGIVVSIPLWRKKL